MNNTVVVQESDVFVFHIASETLPCRLRYISSSLEILLTLPRWQVQLLRSRYPYGRNVIRISLLSLVELPYLKDNSAEQFYEESTRELSFYPPHITQIWYEAYRFRKDPSYLKLHSDLDTLLSISPTLNWSN